MRKICVVTGSRAEYGLLTPLLSAIESDPALHLDLIATGGHLSARHGATAAEIAADGRPYHGIDIGLAEDSRLAIAQAVGRATGALAAKMAELAPDVVVVLGDRYEILAAAQASMLLGIPLAHINGGELTEGAIDECIRHAVTKMASLHFTATEDYRRRVLQMGEREATVFNVGVLSADNLRLLRPLDRAQLETHVGIALTDPVVLATYHPTTADPEQDEASVAALFAALDSRPDATLVFTGVNADSGGAALAARIAAYVAGRANAVAVESLGKHRYLSMLALAAAVIGNSSSGVTEAPLMGVPCVNIGDRQKGRLRLPGIIDCRPDAAIVRAALARALDPQFRRAMADRPSPFGDGHAAERICDILKSFPLADLKTKPFVDIER